MRLNNASNIKYATVRDVDDELHIECRFDDGQKFAAITIDKTISNHDYLAHMICDVINEAPTVTSWVSVHDIIPANGTKVLAFIDFADDTTEYRVVSWLGDKASFYYGLGVDGYINYWQPLPKPPTD